MSSTYLARVRRATREVTLLRVEFYPALKHALFGDRDPPPRAVPMNMNAADPTGELLVLMDLIDLARARLKSAEVTAALGGAPALRELIGSARAGLRPNVQVLTRLLGASPQVLR